MLDPQDIEGKEFKKVALGYSVDEVNDFVDMLVLNYEKVYNENIELKDKVDMLDENINYYRTMEKTLQNTLIIAEKTSGEMREAAIQKSEQILSEANMKADEILNDAKSSIYALDRGIMEMKNRYEMIRNRIILLLNEELELLEKNDIILSSKDGSKAITKETWQEDGKNDIESDYKELEYEND